jgi:uncharacterized protein
MSTTVVSGATGFLGSYVVRALTREGQDVVMLTRDKKKADSILATFGDANKLRSVEWNFKDPLAEAELIECDAILHLAGESLFGRRWTPEQRKVIESSRIDSTKLLVAALAKLSKKPSVFVCASAIGFYGDRGNEELDESSASQPGFLGDICVEWEKAAREAENFGIRVVNIRTGVVLGKEGGALTQLLPPFKIGVGGPVGSGLQWMSWIHIEDAVGMILHAFERQEVKGAMNLTSPNPVTNKEFSATLGKTMGRPHAINTSAFALRLILGDVAEVVLASAKVHPKVAMNTHYHFKYPQLDAALASLVG